MAITPTIKLPVRTALHYAPGLQSSFREAKLRASGSASPQGEPPFRANEGGRRMPFARAHERIVLCASAPRTAGRRNPPGSVAELTELRDRGMKSATRARSVVQCVPAA